MVALRDLAAGNSRQQLFEEYYVSDWRPDVHAVTIAPTRRDSPPQSRRSSSYPCEKTPYAVLFRRTVPGSPEPPAFLVDAIGLNALHRWEAPAARASTASPSPSSEDWALFRDFQRHFDARDAQDHLVTDSGNITAFDLATVVRAFMRCLCDTVMVHVRRVLEHLRAQFSGPPWATAVPQLEMAHMRWVVGVPSRWSHSTRSLLQQAFYDSGVPRSAIPFFSLWNRPESLPSAHCSSSATATVCCVRTPHC